jgi:outer membrane protein assembly factor BamE (lipoprotein component of BamABCDE complex)
MALCACAASGVQVKEEQLKEFQAGKTTMSEVVAKLGQPTTNMMGPDGSRTLVYSYAQVQTPPETFIPIVGAFAGGADVKSNAVVLAFTPDGILKTTTSSSTRVGSGTGLASGTGAPERVPDQPKQAP